MALRLSFLSKNDDKNLPKIEVFTNNDYKKYSIYDKTLSEFELMVKNNSYEFTNSKRK